MAQVLPAERDLRRVIGDGDSVPDGEQGQSQPPQYQRQHVQANVERRGIAREPGTSRKRGRTGRYARTTRAWRLNPRTSSITASIGTPSRHSAIATPRAANRERSPSRRRRQSRYAS